MAAFRLSDLSAGAPQILEWLTEHGLDPERVALSADHGPFLGAGNMTVHLYDEDRAVPPEVRTVPLLRLPPDLYHIDGTPFPATVPA
jgi:hypothetical protein